MTRFRQELTSPSDTLTEKEAAIEETEAKLIMDTAINDMRRVIASSEREEADALRSFVALGSNGRGIALDKIYKARLDRRNATLGLEIFEEIKKEFFDEREDGENK